MTHHDPRVVQQHHRRRLSNDLLHSTPLFTDTASSADLSFSSSSSSVSPHHRVSTHDSSTSTFSSNSAPYTPPPTRSSSRGADHNLFALDVGTNDLLTSTYSRSHSSRNGLLYSTPASSSSLIARRPSSSASSNTKPRYSRETDDEGVTSGTECPPWNTGSEGRTRARTRHYTTPYQVAMLTDELRRNAFPPAERRDELAKVLGMTPRRVQVWFQNRRQAERMTRSRKGDTREDAFTGPNSLTRPDMLGPSTSSFSGMGLSRSTPASSSSHINANAYRAGPAKPLGARGLDGTPPLPHIQPLSRLPPLFKSQSPESKYQSLTVPRSPARTLSVDDSSSSVGAGTSSSSDAPTPRAPNFGNAVDKRHRERRHSRSDSMLFPRSDDQDIYRTPSMSMSLSASTSSLGSSILDDPLFDRRRSPPRSSSSRYTDPFDVVVKREHRSPVRLPALRDALGYSLPSLHRSTSSASLKSASRSSYEKFPMDLPPLTLPPLSSILGGSTMTARLRSRSSSLTSSTLPALPFPSMIKSERDPFLSLAPAHLEPRRRSSLSLSGLPPLFSSSSSSTSASKRVGGLPPLQPLRGQGMQFDARDSQMLRRSSSNASMRGGGGLLPPFGSSLDPLGPRHDLGKSTKRHSRGLSTLSAQRDPFF